ncbi:MAG: hypothetical protein RJA34_566, partial [Pseudomonadota bacterium]
MQKTFETKNHIGLYPAAAHPGDVSHLEGDAMGWPEVIAGDTMNLDSLANAGRKPFAPLDCPPLDSPEHASLIDTSHRRSTGFGLSEVDQPDFSAAARGQMN